MLLTALVFFNTYVWLMAATISGDRLGLAMAFLVSIAAAFVISATLERVRPMLQSTTVLPKDTERLADTPFATMPDAPDSAPLKKAERLNVVFVLAASQLAQILVVAVVTATIYLILGLIVLSPSLLNEWTHTYNSTATVLGFTLPVPDSLIHMSLFLGALTFMYISARAAGDAEYRSTFLDPLIDDLHTTLIARNRYRGAIAAPAAPMLTPPTPVINFTLVSAPDRSGEQVDRLVRKALRRSASGDPRRGGPAGHRLQQLPAQRLSRRAVVGARRAGHRHRKRRGRGPAQRSALLADERASKSSRRARRSRRPSAGSR